MNTTPSITSVEIVRRDTAMSRTSNPKSTAHESNPPAFRAVATSQTSDKHTTGSHGFDLGRPEWHQHGLCRGRVNEFFAQQMNKSKKDELIAVCRRCTVRKECLESTFAFVIDNDGIFGGLTPSQRKALRFDRMQRVEGESA